MTTLTASPSTNGHHEQDEALVLRRLDVRIIEVPIRGTAPLIVNRWSEKAKQAMLDAQQSSVRKKKEPKDPEALFQASMYRLADGRHGFPATGFKAAIVGAIRHFEGMTLVLGKQSLFVAGEGNQQLVPIEFEGEPIMREDTPRNASGVADLRYRASYWPWFATLRVKYVHSVLAPSSVIALVEAGGLGGIGDWRPSAPKSLTGTFGTFEVVVDD
jgi:hypothetical protein